MNEGAKCAHFKENATMKRTGFAFTLLTIFLMSCNPAQAQKPAPKPALVTPAPDLSKLNIEKVLQQVQTTTIHPNSQETSPLQVVAEFLQLRPGQVSELEQCPRSSTHAKKYGLHRLRSRQNAVTVCPLRACSEISLRHFVRAFFPRLVMSQPCIATRSFTRWGSHNAHGNLVL